MKWILILLYLGGSDGIGMVVVPGEYGDKNLCLMSGLEVQTDDRDVKFFCVAAP